MGCFKKQLTGPHISIPENRVSKCHHWKFRVQNFNPETGKQDDDYYVCDKCDLECEVIHAQVLIK